MTIGYYQNELRDLRGNALVNAVVTVFEAGTTDPATLFSDAEGTVSLASNPLATAGGLVLPGKDASANIAFFADDALEYDVRVVDPNGTFTFRARVSGGGGGGGTDPTKVPILQTQTAGVTLNVMKVQPADADRAPFNFTVFDVLGNTVMYWGYNADAQGGRFRADEHAFKWVHETNFGSWMETYTEYLDPTGVVDFRPYFLVIDKADTNPATSVKTHEFVGSPFTWKTAPGPSGTPAARTIMYLTSGSLRTYAAPASDSSWEIHADAGRSNAFGMYTGGTKNFLFTSIDNTLAQLQIGADGGRIAMKLATVAHMAGVGLGDIPNAAGGVLSIVMANMIDAVIDAGKYYAGIHIAGCSTKRQYNDLIRMVDSAGTYLGRFNKDGFLITAKNAAIVNDDLNTSEGSLWWDHTPGTGGLRYKGKDSAGAVISGGAGVMPLTGTQTTTTRRNAFELQPSTAGVGSFSAGSVGTSFNGTMDYVFDIGYNARRTVATEPSFTFTIEHDYEPVEGTHALEAYFEYFSPDGSVSYRPIMFYINRATNGLSSTYQGDTIQFQSLAGANYLVTQPAQLTISPYTGQDATFRVGAASTRSSTLYMQQNAVDVLAIGANASYIIDINVGNGATFKDFMWWQTNGDVGLGTFLSIGSLDSKAVLTADTENSGVAAKAIVARGKSGQTGSLLEVQDNAEAIMSRFDKAGYFMTRKVAAPADADIAAGEMALWFDSTNGAAKLMVKAKQADGTVRTAQVALA